MAFESLEELIQALFQLNIIDPVALQGCYYGMDFKNDSPKKLLKVLEQRHLLTPYQTGCLKRGNITNLIIGNYKLLYRNDSGSFARVFRAAPVGTDEIIALKILRRRWLKDETMVTHFHREAELCQRLSHENIVPIYEVGVDGDQHYFTMEFVEGGNFRDFMKIRKKLSAVEATGYMVQITRALEYALRMGVTHRDMKLSNVLLNTQGVAKLADFGLAGDSDSAIGNRGETPQHALEYATLEKSTGAPRNDPRSDLYFAGTIFYEMLAGKPPYQPTSSRDERKNIMRYMNIVPLRSIANELPKNVTDIVDRLLKVDPDQRYQSASELLVDLEEIQLQLGTHTIPSESSLPIPTLQPGAAPASDDEFINLVLEEEDDDEDQPATILCVEPREKVQDKLREYFIKQHGYRLIIVSDPGRALQRMKQDPPDSVVFMAQPFDKRIVTDFAKATLLADEKEIPIFLALGSKQGSFKQKLQETDFAKILMSPIGTRDLRKAIIASFKEAELREQQKQVDRDSRLIR